MSSLVFKAMKFAEKAHRGVNRKYSDTPYILHPIRVMYRLRDYGRDDENTLCAALLHDTVEDCEDVNFDILDKEFNESISGLVLELTQVDKMNEEVKKLSRAERHKINVDKLKLISQTGMLIKLVDRIDNLSEVDLSNNECYGFLKRRYIQESWDILRAVSFGSSNFAAELHYIIKDLAVKCKVDLK